MSHCHINRYKSILDLSFIANRTAIRLQREKFAVMCLAVTRERFGEKRGRSREEHRLRARTEETRKAEKHTLSETFHKAEGYLES